MSRFLDNLVWRVVLSDDEEDDEDENVLVLERRQYTMLQRIDLDCWDYLDFYQRFRLRKTTVVQVL